MKQPVHPTNQSNNFLSPKGESKKLCWVFLLQHRNTTPQLFFNYLIYLFLQWACLSNNSILCWKGVGSFYLKFSHFHYILSLLYVFLLHFASLTLLPLWSTSFFYETQYLLLCCSTVPSLLNYVSFDKYNFLCYSFGPPLNIPLADNIVGWSFHCLDTGNMIENT